MKVIVLADSEQQKELIAHGVQDTMEVYWIQSMDDLIKYPDADAIIDLQNESSAERNRQLTTLPAKTVVVNAVNCTLKDLPSHFVRINGWPTFLQRSVVEAAGNDDSSKKHTEKIFEGFNRTVEWTPDIPGFITARVIAMIINEAFYAFEEGVSSRADIDTAMKLGTNYPYGPFEWSERIGLHNIARLLEILHFDADRYSPAPLLKSESHS